MSKVLTLDDRKAMRIARNWHDGQGSALYALASTGTVTGGIQHEIEDNVKNAHTPGAIADLEWLRAYVRPFLVDTDITNAERVEHAKHALAASPYDEAGWTDGVTDLLTDLMHFCQHSGIDYDACYASAMNHYITEKD